MTAKKAEKVTEPEPAEFDWLRLSQPTTEEDTSWEPQEPPNGDPGPWWVTDASGAQYATYVLIKGQKPLDESPFNRSGELRTPIPGGTDTAPAD